MSSLAVTDHRAARARGIALTPLLVAIAIGIATDDEEDHA
jgi:hypothetical protein